MTTSSPSPRYHRQMPLSQWPLQSIRLSGLFFTETKLLPSDFVQHSTETLPCVLVAAALLCQSCPVRKPPATTSPVLLTLRLLCHAAQCALQLNYTCNVCIFKISVFFFFSFSCLVKGQMHGARLRAKIIPVSEVAHAKSAAESAVLKSAAFFLKIFYLLS